jgi:hypothetical protein
MNRFHLTGGGEAEVGEDHPYPVTQVGDGIGSVASPSEMRESWRVDKVAEVTANDSDKTLVVPAATEWEILSINVTLTTTVDVGNRQLALEFQDDAGAVIGGPIPAGLVQVASKAYDYVINPGVDNSLALWGTRTVFMRLPHMVLGAGQKVRIYDSAAVAAAADDMTIQMPIATRSVA